MSSINNNFYWVGEQPVSELAEDMVLVNHIDEVATGLGGMVAWCVLLIKIHTK